MTEEQKRFVELNCIDECNFAVVADKLKVERKQLSEWDQLPETKAYREQINFVKRYYNNKKNAKDGNKPLCEFYTFREFYNWYLKQDQKCYYCQTPSSTLQRLFDKENPVLETKRLRGYSLEIDRLNSKSNIYSAENCVLACYFCNNHKSDIISAEDFKQYFAPSIRQYLTDKLATTKTV